MKKVFELKFEGKKFVVETGEIAKQADGAVLVRLNETVVLSTVCCSDDPKEGDFFPLTVGYEEKQYAVGKIPGSFLRREGRAGEHATLTARLIDRPIRPMFSEGFLPMIKPSWPSLKLIMKPAAMTPASARPAATA